MLRHPRSGKTYYVTEEAYTLNELADYAADAQRAAT